MTIDPELVARLSDVELRLAHLEGQKVFTSNEPAKAMDQYIEAHPEMLSVNAEMKRLISLGKVRLIT